MESETDMAEGRVEIEIASPVKKVFDFVADVETHPLYDGEFVESVKITSAKRRGKGMTFTQVRRGSDKPSPSEIIEFAPNKKVVWVAHGAKGDVLVSYWFEKTPRGTRIVHAVSSTLLDDPERLKLSYEENTRELANLKKMMEED
ncbi:MAG: hypothetical protein HW414_1475 [Dehalococcoidia bacterium]|nr:hypothetical protein [Dehalococcoidia bacterium]